MDMPFDSEADLSDDELLALFARGDRLAARLLTVRLTPLAFRHAYRLLGRDAEAEDVAQEAMLRLWRMAPDWRPGTARVSTWLYRVVANLCTDRLRRSGRATPLDEAGEPVDPAPTVSDTMQDAARADALQAALGTLPDRQRQAVVLRHVEELSNPEIADIMEISVEAVESLLARGKRSLTAALKPRKDELGYSQ
ncbi:MAG: RNA polymerase sigma factor [Pseudomonadota bacterium]